jgi:hypothetical protein
VIGGVRAVVLPLASGTFRATVLIGLALVLIFILLPAAIGAVSPPVVAITG